MTQAHQQIIWGIMIHTMGWQHPISFFISVHYSLLPKLVSFGGILYNYDML